MENSTKRKIAKIVSILSEPIIVLSVFVLFILYLLVPRDKIFPVVLQLVFLLIVPIIITRFILLTKGETSNWDISVRRQRIVPFIGLTILLIINYLVMKTFNIPILYDIFRIFIYWMIGFLTMTMFIKLSGHVGVASLVIGIIVISSDFLLWPLLLFIPIIAWSRIVLKRHTLPETIIGALYSASLLTVIFTFNLLDSFLQLLSKYLIF